MGVQRGSVRVCMPTCSSATTGHQPGWPPSHLVASGCGLLEDRGDIGQVIADGEGSIEVGCHGSVGDEVEGVEASASGVQVPGEGFGGHGQPVIEIVCRDVGAGLGEDLPPGRAGRAGVIQAPVHTQDRQGQAEPGGVRGGEPVPQQRDGSL